MNERVDEEWAAIRAARRQAVSFAVAGAACGALLLACAGREASVAPPPACEGSNCDAGSSLVPDAAGSDAALPSDSSDGSTTPGDAGADASASPSSDPCPSDPIAFNCASTCGAGTLGDCTLVSCNPDRIGNDKYLAHVTLPAVLRTPEKPGVDPMCTMSCEDRGSQGPPSDKAHRAYAMAVVVDGFPPDLFRVRVDPPWWIERNGLDTPTFCPLPSSSAGDDQIAQKCLIAVKGFDVLIWTDDPNAPARNIYIESVAQGTTCN